MPGAALASAHCGDADAGRGQGREVHCLGALWGKSRGAQELPAVKGSESQACALLGGDLRWTDVAQPGRFPGNEPERGDTQAWAQVHVHSEALGSPTGLTLATLSRELQTHWRSPRDLWLETRGRGLSQELGQDRVAVPWRAMGSCYLARASANPLPPTRAMRTRPWGQEQSGQERGRE